MMEYQVVCSNRGLRVFIDEVASLLEKGWKLQGGVSSDEENLYQAMVRKELPEQEKKREWKIVRRVCSALVPETGIREFEKELEELTKEGWKPDGDTLSMPVKTGQDPTFILLKPMYREKE